MTLWVVEAAHRCVLLVSCATASAAAAPATQYTRLFSRETAGIESTSLPPRTADAADRAAAIAVEMALNLIKSPQPCLGARATPKEDPLQGRLAASNFQWECGSRVGTPEVPKICSQRRPLQTGFLVKVNSLKWSQNFTPQNPGKIILLTPHPHLRQFLRHFLLSLS